MQTPIAHSDSIRPLIFPLALLSLVTLIFFWPVVLGDPWIIPQGGGDLISFLWPTYRHAAQTLHHGELPLWNPYLYAGAPYAADNQSGLFYPPNLLLGLLTDVPYRVMEWLVLLHVFLAGVGMYVLMVFTCPDPPLNCKRHRKMGREYGRGWWGLVAALGFQFSSVFVTHIGNLNIVATSAYLPWAFLCLWRMALTRQARWAVALSCCMALAVLAGHAQMALLLGMAVGLGGLWAMLMLLRHDTRGALHVAALLTLALVLALGLTALGVLPAIEMVQYTHRADFSYEAAARYSLPPAGLAGMISPLLFGRGARDFWPAWDRVELGYCGLVTLFLSGLTVSPSRWRRFMYLLGAIGMLIAFGQHTPVHRWLYDYVPGFAQLRVPARFILLTDFALAYLAGLGLRDWLQGRVSARRIFAWGGGLLLLTVAGLPLGWRAAARGVSGQAPSTVLPAIAVSLLTLTLAIGVGLWRWRWRGYFGFGQHKPGMFWAWSLLLAAELIGFGAWVEVEQADPDAGYRAGPAVEFLQAQPGPFRIDVAASAWQPNSPVVQRLEAVSGVPNPLALSHYDNYYWSVGYRGSAQYNFLNVRYLVADKGQPAADSTFVPVFDEDPDVDVYLNTNAQPRIGLIYDSVLVTDHGSAFRAVHAPGFDPARSVVLEGGVPLPPAAGGARNLYYTEYTAHQQKVVTVSPWPAYLVFSEVWYPGWRVTVDGRAAEILRANYAFRALYLPPGEHTVEMRFQPRSWQLGRGITLATIVGLFVVGGFRMLGCKLQIAGYMESW